MKDAEMSGGLCSLCMAVIDIGRIESFWATLQARGLIRFSHCRLSANSLGVAGTEALAKALATNSTLQSLE
jgi:hypothetical protein